MMSSSGSAPHLFGSLQTLGRHDNEQAHVNLQRAAHYVRSVMHKRGWRVGVLEEFYPAQASLQGLNVNHGESIRVRLRHPGDERRFLELDHVIGTLLHELVHIVHGPHSAQFYELLEEITQECEKQGPPPTLTLGSDKQSVFWGAGRTLGDRAVPRSQAATAALRAAERRMANAPRVLGGATLPPGRSAREMAAQAALARRARDMEWCSTAESGGAAARAHQWACAVCTLFNDTSRAACEVCLSPRPPGPAGGSGSGGAGAGSSRGDGGGGSHGGGGYGGGAPGRHGSVDRRGSPAPPLGATASPSAPSPSFPSASPSSATAAATAAAAAAAISRSQGSKHRLAASSSALSSAAPKSSSLPSAPPLPRAPALPPCSTPSSPSPALAPASRVPPPFTSPSFPNTVDSPFYGARTTFTTAAATTTAAASVPASTHAPRWACAGCTFLNHPALTVCEMCELPRPPLVVLDD